MEKSICWITGVVMALSACWACNWKMRKIEFYFLAILFAIFLSGCAPVYECRKESFKTDIRKCSDPQVSFLGYEYCYDVYQDGYTCRPVKDK